MKGLKVGLIIAAVALLTMGAYNSSYAYHSGGVAECEGCHTMHNSFEGANPENAKGTVGQANAYLLKGSDQSSTCLNCHNAADTTASSYHISTDSSKLGTGVAPVERTPGGDFAWLKKDYSWVPRSGAATETSAGERHGHNIIAVDYSYVADSKNSVAPGGTYPASSLHCSSCHDPHGKYRRLNDGSIATTGKPIKNSGSYGITSRYPAPDANFAVGVFRLLGGSGYQPKSLSGSFAFTQAPPAAAAPSTYNQSEATNQVRVAYGSGMSEWCSNCHTGFLQNGYTTGMSGLTHPAGNNAKLSNANMYANYNAYVKSGDMSGTVDTAYSSLVPFEIGTSDYTTLTTYASNTGSADSKKGPDSTANVSCLSCHRAHASGFDSMARYSLGNEFMTVADSSGASTYPDPSTNPAQAMGRTTAEMQAAYYDRAATVFAPQQRNLCNKCHAKD